MKKTDFYNLIETICPNALAEEWDNCGIQINSPREDVERVLVSLEITDDVIREAVEAGCDMIVTHHPLIFGSIDSVDNNKYIGNYITTLIRHDISVYSCHTSFDSMDGGNNDCFGQIAGFADISKISDASPMLRTGRLEKVVTLSDFTSDLAARLSVDTRCFRYTGDPDKLINTVSWCTGAGAEYLEDVCGSGCDLYITGDVKYHDAQKAKALGICLLDAGHYPTEKIFVENMSALLDNRAAGLEIVRSAIDLNPFKC